MGGKESYSLRQLVDLTGLSEFTLRGWEGRYGAFEPDRSATGRRRYSGNDLQRALLLRELVRRGHRIGEIATRSATGLRKMLDATQTEPAGIDKPPPEIMEVMSRLSLQDWEGLEAFLHRAIRRRDRDPVLDFLVPLLKEFGALVGNGILSISQEHVLSSMLRELLFGLKGNSKRGRASPRILVAAPEGDFHDLGILAVHVLASRAGLHSLFLGANTPKNELCETALRLGATHIVLGTTISKREGAAEEIFSVLHFLDRNLPASVELWVGGRNLISPGPELSRPHLSLDSIADAAKRLRTLAAPARVRGLA